MLLDISSVLKKPDSQIDVNLETHVDNKEFENAFITFDKPLCVCGKVRNFGGVVMLDAKVSGEYKAVCDRCGKLSVYDISFDFSEGFSKEPDEDEEISSLTDESIDITEAVFKNVFMNLPMKHICSHECKGICPKCGANLNEAQCSCEDDSWNPQFDILKGLFNEEV